MTLLSQFGDTCGAQTTHAAGRGTSATFWMRPVVWFTLVSIMFAAGWGCGYSGPRLFAPRGTMRSQQLNATIHDPYTSKDLGPEVVGGRPRDYIQAQAQPAQDQPYGPRRRATLLGR